MRKTIEVRPEQASLLIGLQDQVRLARESYQLALNGALVGLMKPGEKIATILPTGHIVIEVPDEAKDHKEAPMDPAPEKGL